MQFHLNLEERACIFLSETLGGEISGQAIVRIEQENEENYGFFSTIYVSDDFRKQGVAKKLIEAVLDWCEERNVKRVTYNTAEGHTSIINLFAKFGFEQVLKQDEMVKLELLLTS